MSCTSEEQNGNMETTPEIKSMKEIPGPGPSLPFVGTSWIYWPYIGRYNLEDLHEANLDKFYRYGRICREEFAWKVPFIHLYNPEDMEKVLRRQGKFPYRPPNAAAAMFRASRPDLYSTVGLVNLNGEEWHRLRSSLANLIQLPRIVNHYLPAQNAVCNDVIQLLRSVRGANDVIANLMEPLHRMALESAAMFCLDKRLGCLDLDLKEDHEARVMIDSSLAIFQAYQELYYGGWQLWKYIKTAAYRKMEEAELTIYKIASKYIEEATAKSACNHSWEDTTSVIQALASAEGIHFKDLYTGVVDFITAGIDTSANSLAFLLYHLAANPDVQQRLYDEICSVVGREGDVTSEFLKEMRYLKACVKEAFRMSPTIPNIVRVLPDDLILSGYRVQKGSLVCCETMVASKLPEYVDRPDEFLPERWLSGSQMSAMSFITQPFGYGPRMCPGRRFAEQEIYTTVIKLIQHFYIECVGKMEMEVQYLFIVTPKSPLVLRFVDR